MFLAVVLLPHAAVAPEPTGGARLYRACQASIRMADAGAQASLVDAARGNLCVGYLSGYQDALDAAKARGLCVPNVTTEAIIRVYVAYMDKHPKLLESDMATGVHGALFEAYPCAATTRR